VKVKELNESDYILGLDLEKREVTFEKVECPPLRLESNKIVRITTDVNELLVSEETQLYTASGKKTAANISEKDMLDIFYRPHVFSMIKDLYSSNPRPDIAIDNHEIPITDNFAYLLGTQALVPYREVHRLVLYLESGLNYRKICQILKQALQEIKLPHRVFYRTTDFRKIIIYDDSRENSLTQMISQVFENNEMPEILRVSPTSIMKQFIEGILDSRAKISKGGLVKFYMQASSDKIRRFIFSALALFGIQPRYTFVNKTPEGLKLVSIYLAMPKERPFDLKSLAIASEELLAKKTREDVKVYSAVKHLVKLRRALYLVYRVREHWDLISDLALVHYQSINTNNR
jgi:hypothetical protein